MEKIEKILNKIMKTILNATGNQLFTFCLHLNILL